MPTGPGWIHDGESASTIALRGQHHVYGDGPVGPTSSPGSEHSIGLDKISESKEPSSQLGTVSYVFRRQNPTVTSIFRGRLVTGLNDSSDNVSIFCRDESADICGLYKSIQDFILAVRASPHPANSIRETPSPPEDNHLQPRNMIDKPGHARPASLDTADIESTPTDPPAAAYDAPPPIRPPPPPPPWSLPPRTGSAFAIFLPRAEAPSLLPSDDAPDSPTRPDSPDLGPLPGPPPGSPSRGASPRRAARLEG
jgi:hypothetical protein